MALSTGTKTNAGINVTPLIDVLLVLLIIFMVITPTRSVGLSALLPQPSPDTASTRNEETPIVVHLDKHLNLSVNTKEITFDALAARLGEIYALRASKVLFVQADGDVEFRHVARIIDIAKGRAVDRVALMTPAR